MGTDWTPARDVKSANRHFLAFDNEGRLLGQIKADHLNCFQELDAFQMLHRQTGGGISYFDILAIPPAEAAWIPDLIGMAFPAELYTKLGEVE